jgi:hypothetical protein
LSIGGVKVKQIIVGFHLDEEQHWVADLQCGHRQHMRHDPPMVERPWVLTPDGRRSKIGTECNCKRCDEFAAVVANAVLKACIESIRASDLDAGTAGMCQEGQLELVLDRLKNLKLESISQKAIQAATGEFGILTPTGRG